MGFKGGATGCSNRAQGELENTTKSASEFDTRRKEKKCGPCGCTEEEKGMWGKNYTDGSPFGGTYCKRWSYSVEDMPTREAAQAALAAEAGASEEGIREYTEKITDPSGNVEANRVRIKDRMGTVESRTPVGGSTMVTADVDQGGFYVYGVYTVGGRQVLRVKNGALDLRWHCNQGFDTDTFERVQDAGTTKFDPGGKGGTFGFLRWIKGMPEWFEGIQHLFYNSAGGVTRDNVGIDDQPFDPGLACEYNTVYPPYYRYETQTGTYFWYESEALGSGVPQYVLKTRDPQGFSLYYEYDSDKRLLNISGDVGRLTPYFGYDADQHIDRIYLQDEENEDHRATYFYYSSTDGTLETIVEPEDVVTYFEVDGTEFRVDKEVDPEGHATYLTYDTGTAKELLNIRIVPNTGGEGRVRHFADNGQRAGFSAGQSAMMVSLGTPRRYRRTGYANHEYAVTHRAVGGSVTLYEYWGSSKNQLTKQYDPNLNATDYELNDINYREAATRADDGSVALGYAADERNVVATQGPRHTVAAPQVTYYGYDESTNRVDRILDPLNNTVYFGYDDLARLTQSEDARGGVMYYGYDEFGQVVSIEDGLGHASYFAYNANGKRTVAYDEPVRTTYFSYDQLDRRVARRSPTGEQTSWAFNGRGEIVCEGRPGGRASYWAYDAYHNVTAEARLSESGLVTTYHEYDELDNEVALTDANGNRTETGVDLRGLRYRMKDALSQDTYYVYDPVGNLTHQRDAKGNWSRSEYDNINRLAKTVRGVAGLHAPERASIQGHWNLNETSGDRADTSGNSNTLEDINSVGYEGGWIGNAAYFSFSSGEYLATYDTSPTGLDPDDITVSAWIKPATVPSSGETWSVVSKWGSGAEDATYFGYNLGLYREPTSSDLFAFFRISQDGTTYYDWSATPIEWADVPTRDFFTDRWHHLAASYDSSTGEGKLYLDGLYLDEHTETPGAIKSSNEYFAMGVDFQSGSAGNAFGGAIDEVYVYDEVLNQKQISQLAQQRLEVTFTDDPSDVIADYFQYDHDDNQTVTVGARGYASYFGYDVMNQQVAALDALEQATYFGHDANGNRTATLNARGYATYFAFDLVNRLAATNDALNQTTYYGYDRLGNQAAVAHPNATVSYFGFDASSRLVQQLDQVGSATYFGYDSAGNQDRVFDARENTTYYTYDLLDRAVLTRDALGRQTLTGYDSVGNRTKMEYPCLATEYFGYDALNRMDRHRDRGGFASYFGFDAAGNQDRTLDPRNNATYFGFDQFSRQTVVQDALEQSVYFGYDAADNQTRLEDHVTATSSATTYYGYDALDRLDRQLDALNRETYFSYDEVGNQVEVVLFGNRVTQFQHDPLDRVTATLDPTSQASYFGYDQVGNQTRMLNPRGYSAYFGFDAVNRLEQTEDALSGSTYFVHDAVGNLIRQRDERGFWTYFEYDELNRLTRTTDADDNVTERAYDISGNIESIVPPVGETSYFNYDNRQLLTQSMDGMGNRVTFGYDSAGNRTVVQSGISAGWGRQAWGTSAYGGAAGDPTYFGFDALNRLDRVLDAEEGTAYFGYDVAGNTSRVRDALGRGTYFAYNYLDRLTAVEDALGRSVYFGYDIAGNRHAEMDALEHSTYYGYDLGDRLVAVLDPLNVAAYYGYDSNSNLGRTLDNNQTAVYFGYDGLDRRTRIQYPSESQYFAYDATSNLIETQDNWGTSTFGFDVLSRLTSRETPQGNALYYAYDAVSNLTRLQYPQGTSAAYYAYDDAQRMTKVQSPSGNTTYYEYDASSNVTKKTLGNGVVCWGTYDKTDRVTSLRYAKSDGTPVVYFDYGRDVAGRIKRIGRENDLTIYYDYDDIDRLTGEVWRRTSDLSQIYAFWYDYDAANNRTKMRRESTTGTETESAYYWYDAANALTERTVYPGPVNTYYYYDANGALTEMMEAGDTTYFEYGDNQLISKITPPPADGNAWQFWYDARLNRYAMDKGGTVSYFLWDGLNPVEERDASGSLVARYLRGNTRIPAIGNIPDIERVANSTTYYQYPLFDTRGTAYVIADVDGTTQLSYTLDAFGRELVPEGGSDPNVPNELVYQSNWMTVEAGDKTYGLSKYRLYDHKLGTFLSRDLLPYPNKYRALSNNPVNQVDNTGRADNEQSTPEQLLAERRAAFERFKANGKSSVAINDSKDNVDQIDDILRKIFKDKEIPTQKVQLATDCGDVDLKLGGQYDARLDKTLERMIRFNEAFLKADIPAMRKVLNEIAQNRQGGVEDDSSIANLLEMKRILDSSEQSDQELRQELLETLGSDRGVLPFGAGPTPRTMIDWTTLFIRFKRALNRYLWVKVKGPQILSVKLESEDGNVTFFGNVAFPIRSKLLQEQIISNKWFKRVVPKDIVLEAMRIRYRNSSGVCVVTVEILARYFTAHILFRGKQASISPCQALSLNEKLDLTIKAAKSATVLGTVWRIRTP